MRLDWNFPSLRCVGKFRNYWFTCNAFFTLTISSKSYPPICMKAQLRSYRKTKWKRQTCAMRFEKVTASSIGFIRKVIQMQHFLKIKMKSKFEQWLKICLSVCKAEKLFEFAYFHMHFLVLEFQTRIGIPLLTHLAKHSTTKCLLLILITNSRT